MQVRRSKISLLYSFNFLIFFSKVVAHLPPHGEGGHIYPPMGRVGGVGEGGYGRRYKLGQARYKLWSMDDEQGDLSYRGYSL